MSESVLIQIHGPDGCHVRERLEQPQSGLRRILDIHLRPTTADGHCEICAGLDREGYGPCAAKIDAVSDCHIVPVRESDLLADPGDETGGSLP